MTIVHLNGQPQPEPTQPPAPIPFPSPIDPPLMDPAPEPAQPPAPPGPAPEPEPAAAAADPMGFVRLATLHAEHAERCRIFCIESAAGLADLAAHRIAFGPAPTLTRDQVVSLFRVLAQQVRAFKDPSTMHERAGGPA